ncbi:uncharacterized protein AFUA_6G00380 [Aspergillus fumigatus Af293]|uniref:Uncharacterized protein n=1 Tax=Aspergillus fumigatus (strain CBS 144.89 / FGSC A1163 / CEA10) TaxID=451804 RepID=B0YDX6_ASPFC|nr:conserved hypothetical protein [Aspergillus fumigatus A1163]
MEPTEGTKTRGFSICPWDHYIESSSYFSSTFFFIQSQLEPKILNKTATQWDTSKTLL